jgi:hypothetical protein
LKVYFIRHADTLTWRSIKKFPRQPTDALSDEELQEIKEKVKDVQTNGEENKDKGRGGTKTVKRKGLRPVNAVVEEFVKRVEELLKEETNTNRLGKDRANSGGDRTKHDRRRLGRPQEIQGRT